MTQTKGFHIVRKPEGIVSQFEILVADGSGRPHLALTRFYQRLLQEFSRGAARTYLMALLPYFSFLEADSWRQQRNDRWDSPPECIREVVRDYLLQHLHCKVRRYGAYELVAFSYDEPRYGQRLHFVVWDRPRFVFAHQQYYGRRGPFAVCYLCRAFIIPPTIVVMTPTRNTVQPK